MPGGFDAKRLDEVPGSAIMHLLLRAWLAAAVGLGGLAACPVGGSQAWADEFQLPLSVTEPAGLARTAEPVSGGVPLPPGRFRGGQGFSLFSCEGKELPVQITPLVVDADGWLRWVLVDFLDDLPAGATNQYVLRAEPPGAKPSSPLRVTRDQEGVTVDTGKIRFTIASAKLFSLFSTVSAGGRLPAAKQAGAVTSGGKVSYTDGFDGRTYLADRPEAIELEHAGPIRVTLKVHGRFVGDDKSKLQYIARITAWADSSVVHVKYSVANSNPDHYCYRAVSRSAIELKLAAPPAGVILGAGKPIAAGPDAWLIQCLRSPAAGAARAACPVGGGQASLPAATQGSGEETLWVSKGKDDLAEGWIACLPSSQLGSARQEARLGDGCVYACDLYFADDPARRLAGFGGEEPLLVLEGVVERPAESAGDQARPYADTRRVLYDCSHLSSQYVLDFAAPAEPARLSAAAKAWRNRLWLAAPSEWYLHENEALPLGRFGTQTDELSCYEKWGWKYDRKDIPSRPARSYGRFIRGTDNHYTPEEDPLDQLLIMYLRLQGREGSAPGLGDLPRTPARPYFDNARSCANYWMDLYAWRTDGWRYRDGGVWWYTGPKGNRPQRPADPVTGVRNGIPAPWAKSLQAPWTKELVDDTYFLANSKSCYCHNWGQGLLAWYCLTGERDALEAALDRVEQDYDTQARAFGKTPGKADDFSRDFNRASYLAHAARMIVPDDEFVRTASEFYAKVYLARPTREPRGLVNGAGRWRGDLGGGLEAWVGKRGLAELERLGFHFDQKTGLMTDPKTGHKWYVLREPHTWMFPPLSRAMELYYRLTGDEDAMDWTIAYGQAAARVLYQPHGLLTYGKMLVDFPARGVAKDWASWTAEEGTEHAEGLVLSGYLARFHPDVCARAYSLCGEPLLKQRAYEYWRAGSHRGYQRKENFPFDRVGMWVNYHSDHDGQTDFVGRTLYVWARPRQDEKPPEPVRDLQVTVQGETATVSFTAPADAGGGKVTRYQLKCSDRPIVEYERFLALYNNFEDDKHCNWWMATNLSGEDRPGPAGKKVSFTVSGVPDDAKCFALRSFDDSSNRSGISNVCRVGE